jgi:uncharacterized protein YegJ (DUF2314 family)
MCKICNHDFLGLDLKKISSNLESFWIIKLFENNNYIIGVVNNKLIDNENYDYGDVIKYNKDNHNIIKYEEN